MTATPLTRDEVERWTPEHRHGAGLRAQVLALFDAIDAFGALAADAEQALADARARLAGAEHEAAALRRERDALRAEVDKLQALRQRLTAYVDDAKAAVGWVTKGGYLVTGQPLAEGIASMRNQLEHERDQLAAQLAEATARTEALHAEAARLRELVEAFVHIDYTGQEEALAGVADRARTALASDPAGVERWLRERDERIEAQWRQSHEALGARMDAYHAHCAALREALTCWGVHDPGCPGKNEGLDYCTCGLSEALTRTERATNERDERVKAEARRAALEEAANHAERDGDWKSGSEGETALDRFAEKLRALASAPGKETT